ncbi:sodium/potassium/calcium exchanger 3-like [Actinia tenebrosa]|uniref:Sodium/potassium/calcium exchanger 3-like n=1 Tax=Actinia tenebrosa TaxID=6105 RepID=A0A6P8H7I8_ACTTE|nr:sodium/potassium/calcium exchanger 3-like [Actinia tenebrosa]
MMTCLKARSRKGRLQWTSHMLAVFLFIACGLVLKTLATSFIFTEDQVVYRSRHLLSSVEWEKCDFEIGNTRNYSDPGSWWTGNSAYGWLCLYVFGVLVIFIALAIVCDDFFVPSLEAISEKLDLSEDVAGATFMAAGSSAPELFTSVAGVTVDSDVGVGTVVGSAVFNLLVIIALTAAFSGQTLHLDWRPMLRDGIAYALSIVLFAVFSWDGVFKLYEALILLALYIFYIGVMKYNPQLMDLLAGIGPKGGQVSPHRAQASKLATTEVESLVTEPEVTILQGSHGTPAGKLPPLHKEGEAGERKHTSQHSIHGRQFEHVHKGELSSSFLHIPLRRSQHHDTPRLSISFPILRQSKSHNDLDQVHRRSSMHMHHPEHIRIKSVAQGQIQREIRRNTLMMQTHPLSQTTADLVIPLDANGNAAGISDKEPGPQPTEGQDVEGQKAGDDEEEEGRKMKVCPCLPAVSAETPEYPSDEGICLATIKFILSWILFVLSFPFVCLYTWTIPDCSKPHNRKYFLISFIMSIVWIAILSFAMVTLVGRSGCILSVDKFTMGLVVVAIGTSVPDALSSILVARDGYGDMAVSNAIGSNVFDINLGIGLPFVIKILIDGESIQMLSEIERDMFSSGEMILVPHAKFSFILLLILAIAISLVILFKFLLSKKLGISFVIMYCMFVAYAYIQDLYCNHDC